MNVFYILFSLLLITFNIEAKEESSINSQLVEMLNGPNNVGKDFWITVPPPYLIPDPDSYTRIFVASKYDGTVRLSQQGGIDRSIHITPSIVSSFDLKPGESQPYIYQVGQTGNPAQIYQGKGINITSDIPIIVYVLVKYQATTDGFLALPTEVLGNKYVATNYDAKEYKEVSLPNMLTVVGVHDRTKIKITVGGGNNVTNVDILGGKRISTGESKEWTINKGDVIVMSNAYSHETLSGTLLEADKVFACISGNTCADIPQGVNHCSYLAEMELPINTWGRIYTIPHIEYRKNPSILRVFAKEENTVVYRDGQELFYFIEGIENTGGTQSNAWFETRVWPVGLEVRPAIYSSDKPIYIMLYNPSSNDDDNTKTDPFQMLIPSIEQFQNEIMFYIPSAPGAKNFDSNLVHLIFEVDELGKVPDDLMLGRLESNNKINWNSVKSLFGSVAETFTTIGSGADFEVFENSKYLGKSFSQKTLKLPAEGTYYIKSDGLVTALLTGYADFDSYGFPAGTSVKVLNSGDTTSPNIEWTMGCDGKVMGTTSELTTDINSVGLYFPYSLPDEEINFSPLILDEEFVKGSKSINWSANVIDINQAASLVVTFYDLAGNFIKDTIIYDPKENSLEDPKINIDGDLLLCDDKERVSLILADGNYSRFEWSNGETSKTLTTNKAGEYYATIFDDNSCFKTSDKYRVIVADNDLLEIEEVGNGKRCVGDSITIKIPDVYVGGEITWSTGETRRELIIKSSGIFWYTYDNIDDDCIYYSNTFTIDFNDLPEKPNISIVNFLLKVETKESKIEWYLDGKNINKSDLKVFAPTKNGIYTCEVFNSAGCSEMSEEFEVAFVSVERILENELNITPNPNNGNFKLEINSKFSGVAKLTIIDLNGQEVFSKELNLTQNRYTENINLNNTTKGVYLLKIKTESGEVSSKFIVK